MSKHNRGKHNQSRRGKGYKAQAKDPAQIVQEQAKAKDQEVKDQEVKDQVKAGLIVDNNITTGQTKATDSKGQTVLTKEDKAKIDKVKAAQVKAQNARRKALEAQREAKEALDELSSGGSGAIKAMRQELEAKIKAQEAKAEAIRDSLKIELDSLNSLYVEFKGLTGLDKAAKSNGKKGNGKGKGKSKAANGNGRFEATVKANGDQVKVLVTHRETKSLFETSLYPTNGQIKADDWLALRHRFIAHFEAKGAKSKADKALSAKDYNLVLRAFLSNLKGKVEAIKPIL